MTEPVDNSTQQSVDNSQEHQTPVDNSQNNGQSVDNSQEHQTPVDNSQNNNETVDNSNTAFDAQKYLASLEPEAPTPDVTQLQAELQRTQQERDALKDAYLKLKQSGITLVSNPQQQASKDPNADVDAALKKWVHG